MAKINIKAAALAFGISWGGFMILVGLAAMAGWGTKFVDVMSSVYIGFSPTAAGALIGGLWGLVDGAIGGAVMAYIYNLISKK